MLDRILAGLRPLQRLGAAADLHRLGMSSVGHASISRVTRRRPSADHWGAITPRRYWLKPRFAERRGHLLRHRILPRGRRRGRLRAAVSDQKKPSFFGL